MTDNCNMSARAELLWGEPSGPRRGRKPALSNALIVAEAIKIADSEGLARLSMQRLAQSLGKGTMSLYRYIDSKDDLIALMLDTAIGPPDESHADSGNWRTSLEGWARDTRAIFLKHPWTLPLVTTRRTMGPHETARLEAALRAISELNLTREQMIDTVLLVNGFVRGTTQPELNDSEDSDPIRQHDPSLPEVIETFDRRRSYPMVTSVLRLPSEVGGDPAERAFEFGLACVLDGIESQLS